jgi:hypothetical protein
MDEFEKKLKALTLVKPSKDLRQRIFGDALKEKPWDRLLSSRIPLAWAAGAALLMWLAGFFMAFLFNHLTPTPSQGSRPIMNVNIIYEAPQTPNPFDFTNSTPDFLPGNFQVKVETKGEV